MNTIRSTSFHNQLRFKFFIHHHILQSWLMNIEYMMNHFFRCVDCGIYYILHHQQCYDLIFSILVYLILTEVSLVSTFMYIVSSLSNKHDIDYLIFIVKLFFSIFWPERTCSIGSSELVRRIGFYSFLLLPLSHKKFHFVLSF